MSEKKKAAQRVRLVLRDESNGIWWIRWREGGKARWRSTGEVDVRAAGKVRKAVEGRLRQAESARRLHRLAGVPMDLPLADAEMPTEFKRRGLVRKLRSSTREATAAVYRRFREWAHGRGYRMLGEFSTAEACGRYRAQLSGCGLSGATVNRHLMALSAVWRCNGVASGWRAERCMEEPVRRREFSEEEALRIADCARGEMRTLIEIMRNTGLRLGDAVALRFEDYDAKSDMIRRKTGKTGAEVAFPALGNLGVILRASARTGPLCPGLLTSYKRGRQRVAERLNEVVAKVVGERTAERAEGVRRASVYGSHSFRHSFAVRCRRAGVELETVREWLGHGSKEITRIYATHIREEDMRRAGALLGGINIS